MNVMENGVACDPNNPALKALIEAVKTGFGWRGAEDWEETPRHERKICSGRSGRCVGAVGHWSACEG